MTVTRFAIRDRVDGVADVNGRRLPIVGRVASALDVVNGVYLVTPEGQREPIPALAETLARHA